MLKLNFFVGLGKQVCLMEIWEPQMKIHQKPIRKSVNMLGLGTRGFGHEVISV